MCGQMSAEAVKQFQSQFQSQCQFRVADGRIDSNSVDASFISLLYSISVATAPHLPCCVFGCFVPVASGVILGLVRKLLALSYYVAGMISCQLGSHPTAKACSFALEQRSHPCCKSEWVEQLSVRFVLCKHGEAVTICVAMSCPVCV